MGLLDLLFGRKAGSKLPGYKADHQISERQKVHGFLAYYTGDDGDPRHTLDLRVNREVLQDGWGIDGRPALLERVADYERGETGYLAFDLIRAIRLARHGAGAGWISDDESWQLCFRLAQRLQTQYTSWFEVYEDFQTGRDAWWRQVKGKEPPPEEYEEYAQRYAEGDRLIFSKVAFR